MSQEIRKNIGRLDHVAELGPLALASRLRRVLERLFRDGKIVYETIGIDFEVRWFPAFHLLSQHAPLSIVEIATALGQSHPTVIQMVDEMITRGLLKSKRDSKDGRRREIFLSPKGQDLLRQLRPVWQSFAVAGQELATEAENDFITAMDKLESALRRKSMAERIIEKLTGSEKEVYHD